MTIRCDDIVNSIRFDSSFLRTSAQSVIRRNQLSLDMSKAFRNPTGNFRQWIFRLLAVLLALLPFLLLEAALAALGIGEPDLRDDPFVGFNQIVPLFELDAHAERYVISPVRLSFFAHDEFPAVKSPETFRVFCLGGSTVQGRPYSIETSFTTWLRLALKEADPETNWEIVNCGGISYASYRLNPILEECLQYEPDLFIICTGHNEFLEDRSYRPLKRVPDWGTGPAHALMQARTVFVASQMFGSTDHRKPLLKAEVDAMLDYRNGLAAFHRDEQWNAGVVAHFETNLRRMVQRCRSAGVPVLVLQPPANLSGVAPFKSESALIDNAEAAEILALRESARACYTTNLGQATKIWQQICEEDPLFARHWYELGQCLQLQGRIDEARQAFIRARDLDVCPLRMTTPIEQAIRCVVHDENIQFVDVQALLEGQTASGILGNQWLVDHVHPSFAGHQEIALALAKWMESQQLVKLPEQWEARSRATFLQHFESLERAYFHKGNRMLDALRKWTQSDTDGEPAELRFPHRFQSVSN